MDKDSEYNLNNIKLLVNQFFVVTKTCMWSFKTLLGIEVTYEGKNVNYLFKFKIISLFYK